MSDFYVNVLHKTCQNETIESLDGILELDATLNVNRPGVLSVVLPGPGCNAQRVYAVSDFSDSDSIEIWLTPHGQNGYVGETPHLFGETVFLVDKISQTRDNAGRVLVEVEAASALALASRRIVAYSQEQNTSEIEDDEPLDDEMRTIFQRNYQTIGGNEAGSYTSQDGGGNAIPDPDRTISSGYFTAQPDVGLGPLGYSAQAHNLPILTVLEAASDWAFNNGTPMFFDVVKSTATADPPVYDGLPFLEFRVYPNGQRGTDRRQGVAAAPTVISENNSSLTNYNLSLDWSDSLNRVYSAQSGARNEDDDYFAYVPPMSDPDLQATLQECALRLRERFVVAQTDTDADAATQMADTDSTAEAELGANLARTQVSGEILSADTFSYIDDWTHGDRVSVAVGGVTEDAWIERTNLTLIAGELTLTSRFNNTLNRSPIGINETIFQMLAEHADRLDLLRARAVLA